MSKKRGLGKGLSALLENADTDITTMGTGLNSENQTLGSTSMIGVRDIETNPFQPRTEFEKEALEDLASSIEQYGIIQPLTVRKSGNGKFQLISGERRFRASQMVGLDEVPCYIRIADDQTMLEMALVENVQRENLNPMEVAISYERLIEECSLTQAELSSRIGKNRTTVTNYLRLLKLPDEIQIGLTEKKLSMGHARALLSIDSERKQLNIYRRILSDGLSVRKVEELARENNFATTEPKKKKATASVSFEQQKFVSKLTGLIGNKVKLKSTAKGNGKIEIPFASEADLRRIADILDI